MHCTLRLPRRTPLKPESFVQVLRRASCLLHTKNKQTHFIYYSLADLVSPALLAVTEKDHTQPFDSEGQVHDPYLGHPGPHFLNKHMAGGRGRMHAPPCA